jgi:hypothetical protein
VYDIIFISYGEPNAEENYQRVKARFPLTKRVKDVKGIHQAHIKAARMSFTEMFWVVDGDAQILDSFDFDYKVPEWDLECVHVWRSRNPLNNLTYGYGGVKLLPKKLTIAMDLSKPDMTTSISKNFKAMEEISNITAFNTDAFSTWRSAFRECVKLSSRTIEGQIDTESESRLYFWCQLNTHVPFGSDGYVGAIQGKEYGLANKNDPEALLKINDYQWLKEQYENFTGNIKESLSMV